MAALTMGITTKLLPWKIFYQRVSGAGGTQSDTHCLVTVQLHSRQNKIIMII